MLMQINPMTGMFWVEKPHMPFVSSQQSGNK